MKQPAHEQPQSNESGEGWSMNKQRSGHPRDEQEKAEGQQDHPPSTLLNQATQSRPSINAPIVVNEQNQCLSQEIAERRQGPPAWLLPVLMISFVITVITAAILSIVIRDTHMMLVALVMTFMLVYGVVRYYF